MGVDLVDVGRFADTVARTPRLLNRVFTQEELRECSASRNQEERLAARFAAKEAVFKALGAGWPDIRYHDVEVHPMPGGAPALRMHGRAVALCAGRTAAVSLSHAGGMAVAQVVIA